MNQLRLARRSNRVVRRWPHAQRTMSRLHAKLYVLTAGRLVSSWFSGAPVMVLQTMGRRSGEVRLTPVLYLRHGDALVVMAANAGADRTPAWWLNLRHTGEGIAIIGRTRLRVRPRLLAGAERHDAWQAFVKMYPQAQFYDQFTDRHLPLIALEPSAG
jgi:deazaflavin-dependent oxidoreductase (nitroreductase family)